MSDLEIDRLARKRAAMRMGWWIHATAFVAVNTLLALLSFGSGRHWAIFPFVGWGIGLAIHGLVVQAALPGSGLMQRMVEQERRRLAARRDPW